MLQNNVLSRNGMDLWTRQPNSRYPSLLLRRRVWSTCFAVVVRGTATTTTTLHLHTTQRRTQSSILNTQLVDKSPTFFPPSVGFVCGSKSGIEQLRTGFQSFYMLVPTLSKCPLCLPILFRPLTRTQGTTGCRTRGRLVLVLVKHLTLRWRLVWMHASRGVIIRSILISRRWKMGLYVGLLIH